MWSKVIQCREPPLFFRGLPGSAGAGPRTRRRPCGSIDPAIRRPMPRAAAGLILAVRQRPIILVMYRSPCHELQPLSVCSCCDASCGVSTSVRSCDACSVRACSDPPVIEARALSCARAGPHPRALRAGVGPQASPSIVTCPSRNFSVFRISTYQNAMFGTRLQMGTSVELGSGSFRISALSRG